MSAFLLLTVIFWCLTTYFPPKTAIYPGSSLTCPEQPPAVIWEPVSWAYILCACTHASSLSRVSSVREAWLPGSSVPGILQARILEWLALPSSRGSSWLRDWIHVSCILHFRRFPHHWTIREASTSSVCPPNNANPQLPGCVFFSVDNRKEIETQIYRGVFHTLLLLSRFSPVQLYATP